MSGEERFARLAESLSGSGARRSQMMGRPMLTIAGRMFACLDEADSLSVRLGRDTPEHAEALALPGADVFEPGGRGRRFRDWVSLPDGVGDRWEEFAVAALVHTAGGAPSRGAPSG